MRLIEYIKEKYYVLKYNLEFLNIYFSPFKNPNIKFYFGEIKIGTPYFLPRKKVKIQKDIYRFDKRKFGFDFCGLGWKTKYNEYRHEYDPVFSFVFFNKQIALIWSAPIKNIAENYWEAWLFYYNETDHIKDKLSKLKYCINKYPCIYTVYKGKNKHEIINLYDIAIKEEYLNKLK